jgi:hypothetical protein
MTERTVREQGGEIWAELHRLPESELHWKTRERVADIVMGVLARHVGEVIQNDGDLPVVPLPRS